MKSLKIFTYKQPLEGSSLRVGVVAEKRDTKKNPLSISTILGDYRKSDPLFRRTRKIETIRTPSGYKQFYKERMGLRVTVPLIGGIVEKFFK